MSVIVSAALPGGSVVKGMLMLPLLYGMCTAMEATLCTPSASQESLSLSQRRIWALCRYMVLVSAAVLLAIT